MCTEVTNTDTGETVETVRDLIDMLKIPVDQLVLDSAYTDGVSEDACLCPIDCKATVEKMGYVYSAVDGDDMEVEIHKLSDETNTIPG